MSVRLPLEGDEGMGSARLPHLERINELLDKSDLRIGSMRAFGRSFMTGRLRYGTSDSGFYDCRVPRTSLTKVGHLGQETAGEFANLGNNSTGNYLL